MMVVFLIFCLKNNVSYMDKSLFSSRNHYKRLYRREVTDIRTNTARPMFKNVVSLTTAHGLFYWTNGFEVLTEEYHPGQNAYFHNIGGVSSRTYVSIGVDSAAAQPIPVPVNPPTCLQAVLGASHATAAWAPPHLLGGQGRLFLILVSFLYIYIC